MATDLNAAARPTCSAAFFDLDHVLMPGSSLFLLARDLRSHDVYRPMDLVRSARQRAKTRLAQETDRDLRGMRNEILASITGRQHSELQGWCRQLATYEILPRVYPDIVKIIAAHRAAGDRTYLVTAAPFELAEPVARALEIDEAMGTVAALDPAGRFTGRRVGELLRGSVRADAIEDLAKRDNIDLMRTHVYSSSADDEHLLRTVGHPHAVNPEAKLWKVALRHGWAVHEMRPIRRQILVGLPPLVSLSALVGAGFAAGRLLRKRK